ncbi:MAG: hypothetical protein EXS68_01890 [Candidatus Ryanbacteria bacterium]|nr:hypothetical protein [Candidatus Ryanbacteria bacterium]
MSCIKCGDKIHAESSRVIYDNFRYHEACFNRLKEEVVEELRAMSLYALRFNREANEDTSFSTGLMHVIHILHRS